MSWDVLALIDAAIDDWSVSGDAMRSQPADQVGAWAQISAELIEEIRRRPRPDVTLDGDVLTIHAPLDTLTGSAGTLAIIRGCRPRRGRGRR